MKAKLLAWLFVALAVIAAAVAGIVVSNNRAAEARAFAEAEAAAADKAQAEAKAAAKNAEAEAERRRAAEANAKAKKDDLEAKRLALDTAQAEASTAKANAEIKASEAKLAEAKAAEASTLHAEAKARADSLRAEAEKQAAATAAETAKRQAADAALEQERVKADRIIAEAKALELRKIDFETLERELLEFKRDLDEREAALRPEKTITDLVWLEDEDTVVDEKGNVKKREKAPYLAENDYTLPKGTRTLARAEREAAETQADGTLVVRDGLVGGLEKLYVEALKEDRVVDADFYRKSIKSLYPDWEFKGEK